MSSHEMLRLIFTKKKKKKKKKKIECSLLQMFESYAVVTKTFKIQF